MGLHLWRQSGLGLQINTTFITPSFAGLSGAGLYQINFKVPAGVGSGDLPLKIQVPDGTTYPGPVISMQ